MSDRDSLPVGRDTTARIAALQLIRSLLPVHTALESLTDVVPQDKRLVFIESLAKMSTMLNEAIQTLDQD